MLNNRGNSNVMMLVLAAIVVVILGYGYSAGYFTEEAGGTGGTTETASQTALQQAAGNTGNTGQATAQITPGALGGMDAQGQALVGAFPIESLKAQAKNKFTMATATGNISFYVPGADVSNPYVLALDTITLASGSGSTTNYVIQTNGNYDIYWKDYSGTYYDELILDASVNYNPDTGKGFLLIGGSSFYSATDIGTLKTLDTAAEADDVWDDVGTSLVAYNTSQNGTVTVKYDIGNSDANSELQGVVMCFGDSAGTLESDEITSFTASFDSGNTNIAIPGDLLEYWRDAAGSGSVASKCFPVAAKLGPSEKARWQFDIAVDAADFVYPESFQISFDDLGKYKGKQYPSSTTGATVTTLNITSCGDWNTTGNMCQST